MWFLFMLMAYEHDLSIYLFKQSMGQIKVLFGAESLEDFAKTNNLNEQEKKNLNLIESIKQYSVDSLGYKPTNNFKKIYDQHHKPILWVITASEKYELKPYEWD